MPCGVRDSGNRDHGAEIDPSSDVMRPIVCPPSPRLSTGLKNVIVDPETDDNLGQKSWVSGQNNPYTF